MFKVYKTLSAFLLSVCKPAVLTLDMEKTGKEEKKRREKKIDRKEKKWRTREMRKIWKGRRRGGGGRGGETRRIM